MSHTLPASKLGKLFTVCFWLIGYLDHLCFDQTLSHWGRDEMDIISLTTFSNVFSKLKMFEFRLKFHWSLFRRVKLAIFQHRFRKWLGAVQSTSHYLNQWWLVYRHIYASLRINELFKMQAIETHPQYTHWSVLMHICINLLMHMCINEPSHHLMAHVERGTSDDPASSLMDVHTCVARGPFYLNMAQL